MKEEMKLGSRDLERLARGEEICIDRIYRADYNYDYAYRTLDGALFRCKARTLKECRRRAKEFVNQELLDLKDKERKKPLVRKHKTA